MSQIAAGEILIKYQARPCIARDKKGLFYTWIEKTDMFNHRYMAGLIEFEDGTVDEVNCCYIKFCDNPFKEYSFDRR